MRRTLLVVAMVVSLWPLALVVSAVANSGSHNADNGNSAEQAAESELKALNQRQEALQHQLHSSQALHGTSDESLALTATELSRAFAAWSVKAKPDEQSERVAILASELDSAIAGFAQSPSESGLTVVNKAGTALNQALESARG
jgi:hypothetical protein